MKVNVKFLLLLSVCLSLNNMHALRISEIMYDPEGSDTGREWVEIYNDGSAPEQISNYKLNESTAADTSGSNHTIVGTDMLAPNQYAIIAEDINKFRIDYPNYGGIIYRASYGPLSNSSGINISLRIKPANASDYNIVSEYNYDNLAKQNLTSGNSICNAVVDSSAVEWRECSATPGAANNIIANGARDSATTTDTSTSVNSTTTNSNTNTETTSQGSLSVPVGISYYVPNPNLYIRVGDMSVESLKEKSVLAGAEFELIVRAYSQNGKAIPNAKYYWSMGDGGYFEGEKIKYVYHLPGEYNYTVEAGNENSYSLYKGKIIVNDTPIYISDASTTVNQFKIRNDNSEEIDIGGYILKDNINNKSYKIPRNTFVKAKGEIKLNGEAMRLTSTSSDYYSLYTPNGNLLKQYIRPTSTVLSASSTLAMISVPNAESINKKFTQGISANKVNSLVVIKKPRVISYTQKLNFDSRY